jgi:cytochrome c
VYLSVKNELFERVNSKRIIHTMKKKLIIPVIAFFAIAPNLSFGQNTKKKIPVRTVSSAKTVATTPADIADGKALIAKSDCLACHKLDTKLVGPAYNNVAKKYPATADNYEQLANKIIKGGAGVWGQVPMSPHASLSVNDAKKMTKYILSLH